MVGIVQAGRKQFELATPTMTTTQVYRGTSNVHQASSMNNAHFDLFTPRFTFEDPGFRLGAWSNEENDTEGAPKAQRQDLSAGSSPTEGDCDHEELDGDDPDGRDWSVDSSEPSSFDDLRNDNRQENDTKIPIESLCIRHRRVHFCDEFSDNGCLAVIHYYAKPAPKELSLLYYSVHELQKFVEDAREKEAQK